MDTGNTEKFGDVLGITPEAIIPDDLELGKEFDANANVRVGSGGTSFAPWLRLSKGKHRIRIPGLPVLVLKHTAFGNIEGTETRRQGYCTRFMLRTGKVVDSGRDCIRCADHEEHGANDVRKVALTPVIVRKNAKLAEAYRDIADGDIVVKAELSPSVWGWFNEHDESGRGILGLLYFNPDWGDFRQYDIDVTPEYKADGRVGGYSIVGVPNCTAAISDYEQGLLADLVKQWTPKSFYTTMLKKELEAK